MHDVDLSIGADASPASVGLAELRNFGQQARAELTGIFAQTFAITGAIAAFDAIINKAHEIHHEADRFRIDSEQLQTIGNAAQEMGIPLNLVARAMNLIEINAYKAAQGSEKELTALTKLGINAREFYALSADQKTLALADAYARAGDKSEAYANIAVIIGRRNTELIPLFEKGAEAIRQQSTEMGILGDKSVEAGDKMFKAWQQVKNLFVVEIGGNIVLGLYRLVAALKDLGELALRPISFAWKQITFDIKGATEEAAKFMAVFAGKGPGMKMIADLDKPKTASPPGTRGEGISGGPSAGGGEAGAVRALRDEESLREKIDKLEADHAARQRTDQQQLQVLLAKDLELYQAQVTAAGDTNTALEARKAYLENQAEIDKVTANIAKDQLQTDARITREREQAAGRAEAALVTSKEQTKELNLELQGRKDLSERAKIEFDYDQKIKDATDEIAKAEAKGFAEVAATNRALVQQLTLEKQNALAVHDKAEAEKAAAEATALHNQDLKEALALHSQEVSGAKSHLADLQEQTAEQAQIASGHADIAAKMHDEWEWQGKINEATDAANTAWEKMNEAYAEGKTLLGDQYAELAKINESTALELQLQKQISAEEKAQADLKEQTRQQENALSATYGSVLQGDNLKNIANSPGFKALLAAGYSETEIWQMFLNPNYKARSIAQINPSSRGGPWGGYSTYMATPAQIVGATASAASFPGQVVPLLASIDKKLSKPIGGH